MTTKTVKTSEKVAEIIVTGSDQTGKMDLLGLLAKSSTGSSRDSVFGKVDFAKFKAAVEGGTVTIRKGSIKEQILKGIIELFDDGEVFGVKAAETRGLKIADSKMTLAANLRWYKDWLKKTVIS